MAYQISPGVSVTETDLTNVVPAVATADAAFASAFSWGPVDQITQISSENELVSVFGGPTSDNNANWLTAASFLAYAGSLSVVRVTGNGAAEATSTNFDAKYEGERGDGIKVHVVTDDNFASCALKDLLSGAPEGNEISIIVEDNNGAGTCAVLAVAPVAQETETLLIESGSDSEAVGYDAGDIILADALALEPGDAVGNTTLTADAVAALTYGGTVDVITVAEVVEVTAVSATSNYVQGTILEVHEFMTSDPASKYENGASSYIGNVLDGSSYVSLITHVGLSAGKQTLANGNDGTDSNGSSARIEGYDLFNDPDAVDISLIFVGEDEAGTLTQSVVNIAESRKDCVVFSSAPSSSSSAATVLGSTWYTAQSSSSYLIMDSGYKKMYDRYNDTYVDVPLNGDIAGLCVFTDEARDPWFSPAGMNRGTIKNVVNLLYSPNKTDRDDLYKAGVNPVASFTGQGTVLFGDKTFLRRPSSFDRINVRRLMIFLEKMIGRAARSLLFEFNDEFTRSSFVNMVTPTLRDVQGRRGISDFLVICDESNNTADVIDNNQFVGSILVKPNRSINYIQLNFVAVRTGVEFSEVAL